MREDEMVGRHHQFNRCEFEQSLGYTERQESLTCCSTWGCKESDWLQAGHHAVNFSTWWAFPAAHRIWLRILPTATEEGLKALDFAYCLN